VKISATFSELRVKIRVLKYLRELETQGIGVVTLFDLVEDQVFRMSLMFKLSLIKIQTILIIKVNNQ